MTHTRSRLVALALLLAPVFVLAASTPPSAPPAPDAKLTKQDVETAAADAAKSSPDTVKLESLEVTGTRIRLNAGEAPAVPVFSLSQVELEHLGVNRLADLRQALPQLQPSVGFNDNLVNGGPSRGQQVSTTFNLRGLGGGSTLVLVDGHRVPHSGQEAPGGAGGREDYNVDGIPVSAIERVEILPQGAGAIYGSDAIGGVVNIILKKNYSGAEISFNYDNTFNKDMGDTSVSLTAGFTRGKLKTFVTASWEHQNALMSRDRWFTATADISTFGATAAQNSFYLSQPPAVSGLLASTTSPQNTGQANLPGLTTNFVIIPAGSRGTGLAVADYGVGAYPARYDPNQYSTLIDPAKRRSFVLKGDYDLAPWLQPYAEVRWSRFENFYTGTPITFASQSLPSGYPGNPFAQTVFLRKVFYDLPAPQQNSYQDNTGLTAGFRGKFLEDWRYDAGFSYARNTVNDDNIAAGFTFSLLNAAINNTDVSKRPVLTYDSSKPGTDPNPAGYLLSLAPVFDHRDTTEVYDTIISADGPVWSGWAGDLKLALGGEVSEEKVKFHRDTGDSSLGFTLTKPFSRRMTAGFAEVSVPLLSEKQHIPGIHRLEISGAIRSEEFSDIGSHNTPRYSAILQPFAWLTLRASRAEGFKVGRLYDLQGPVTTGTSTLTATNNVHDTLRGGELVLGTVTSISGGNPTLKPETSVSKNGGVVIDVPGRWFKGLSLSVDTWELHYNDKIGSPSRQVLIDFFPERVIRGAKLSGDPANYAGPITGFDSSNINLSKYDARGLDYGLSYQRATPFGLVSVTGAFSDPKVIAAKATPAATTFTYTWLPMRAAGSVFLRHGAWSYGTTMSYQTPYRLSTTPTAAAYPSIILWNPQVSYDFGRNSHFGSEAGSWWQRALSGSKCSVTIANIFNSEPNPADVINGRIIQDPRLRRYILAFSKKL
jgi:outer membrane receptor protein involved in Fe transport